MNRHYKTLELDKMLDRLAGLTNLPDAKEMALALEPQTDIDRPSAELQTAPAYFAEPRRAAAFRRASF